MCMVLEKDNLFTYENPCCDCSIATDYMDDGNESQILMIKSTEEFHTYAYKAKDGLVLIQKNGKFDEKEQILHNFINIDSENINDIREFINKYGFLIPLPANNKYEKFYPRDLTPLIEHFKKFVKLLTAIKDSPINYNDILEYTVYFLFTKPHSIFLSSGEEVLSSCEHAFTNLWYDIDNLPIYKHKLIKDEVNGSEYDYYLIPDLFTGKEEQLYVEYYNDEYCTWQDSELLAQELGETYAEAFAESVGVKRSLQVLQLKITKLYRDAFGINIDERTKYAIDFFTILSIQYPITLTFMKTVLSMQPKN